MRLLLFLSVGLLLVLALGCTSQAHNGSSSVTGMAIIDTSHAEKNVTVDKQLISDCVNYCLKMNKYSSGSDINGWYMNFPGFCTNNCTDAGVKCTVMFLDKKTCDVKCDEKNVASCS